MKKTYLIIGSSAAGIAACTTLARLEPASSIICITRQPELPYNMCLLAAYLHGAKSLDALQLFGQNYWATAPFTLRTATEVIALHPQSRTIELTGGEQSAYTKLLLATGTHQKPQICIADNSFSFYTLEQAEHMVEFIQSYKPKRVVVVGGGLNGLECADALTARGIAVTLIEQAPRLAAPLLSPEGSTWLERYICAQGVQVYTDTLIEQYVTQSTFLTKVHLATGIALATDMLVYTTGSTPNIELARNAGLTVTKGVVVDDYLQTSDPDVYAAGDCALVKHVYSDTKVLGCTWADASMQGMVAAYTMANKPRLYPGAQAILYAHCFGITLWGIGVLSSSHVRTELENNCCVSYFLHNDGSIIGASAVGLITAAHREKIKRAVQLRHM